jgi:hypothetical protein
VSFGITVATYAVAYEGLWQSLASFPWKPWPLWEPYRGFFRLKLDLKADLASSCGWPYDRCLKDVLDAQKLRVNRSDALLVSMLIGFWVFCLQALFSDPLDRLGMSLFALVSVLVLIGFRASIYTSGCTDPISFMGRIRTGKWIIPGYDKIAIGIFLPLLAVPAALGPCWAASVPWEISLPAALSVAWATTLLAPPRLLDWRLTGKYRMVWLSPTSRQSPSGDAPNAPYVKVG